MVFLPSYSSSVRYQWWSSTWGSIWKKFQAMEPRRKIGTPWSFYKFIVSDFTNLERVVLSNQKVQDPLRGASLTLFDHLQLRVCLIILLKKPGLELNSPNEINSFRSSIVFNVRLLAWGDNAYKLLLLHRWHNSDFNLFLELIALLFFRYCFLYSIDIIIIIFAIVIEIPSVFCYCYRYSFNKYLLPLFLLI